MSKLICIGRKHQNRMRICMPGLKLKGQNAKVAVDIVYTHISIGSTNNVNKQKQSTTILHEMLCNKVSSPANKNGEDNKSTSSSCSLGLTSSFIRRT